jgi:hypothetical protein
VISFRRVFWLIPAVCLWVSGAGPVFAQSLDTTIRPGELGFTVAYDDPNVCVASVFYASGRQILETPGSDRTSLTLPSTGVTETPPDEIPDCITAPGFTSVPAQSTPTTITPQTPDPPAGKTGQSQTTTALPDESQPEAAPELGLVKAQDTLVSLILTKQDDGQPLEGAIVKLLTAEPDLPTGDNVDARLSGPENYSDDVEGVQLGDAGQVLLSVSSQPGDDLSSIKLTEVPDEAGVEAAPAAKPALARVVQVARQNPQLVVATKADWTRLPATLAPRGAKICVNRNFSIGERNIHVVSLPEQAVEEFTRNASGWEETVFVEPDPCRNKEDDKDPLYESSGLWGQAFDNQWAIKRVGYEEKKFPPWRSSTPDWTGIIPIFRMTGSGPIPARCRETGLMMTTTVMSMILLAGTSCATGTNLGIMMGTARS